MDNYQIAKSVLELVGGPSNVISVVHCATRLRFKLKDRKVANKEAIEKVPGVVTVVEAGGQFQVVIGNNVNMVYQEMMKLGNFNEASDEVSTEKGSIFGTIIDMISSIFTPFIGAMAGAGILKGVLTLASVMNWLPAESGAYQILFAAADGLFYSLPILIAFTAAKRFKVNQFVSVAIAAALIYPNMAALAAPGAPSITFFGIPVIMMGYSSTVIPILLAVFIQSLVEKPLMKWVHQSVRNILVPFIVLVVVVPLTFIVFGPMGTYLGNALAWVYESAYSIQPWLAGLILGGLWQVFVIFGVHWAFIPIAIQNLTTHGYDTMTAMLLPAVLAQTGAVLAVMLKTKNKELKAMSASNVITTLFGITEPTVYGITLKYKKPFIFACIGAAIGSAYLGFMGIKTNAMALVSVLSIPSYAVDGSNPLWAVYGSLIAIVIAFVLTYFFGFKDEEPTTSSVEAVAVNGETLVGAVVDGQAIQLEEVNDKVFASLAMGKGIAIYPESDTVVAPFDGEVATLFPTKHAIGIIDANGVELLIHIGIDTVSLEGKGFEAFIEQGAKVTKGQKLVRFDRKVLDEAKLDPTVMMVVTNTANVQSVEPVSNEAVKAGDTVIVVKK